MWWYAAITVSGMNIAAINTFETISFTPFDSLYCRKWVMIQDTVI